MLYSRYPERFNILGQIKWRGTIPGLLRTVPGGSRKNIFWAAKRPGVATVLDPALTLMRFLPQTLEWTLAAMMLVLVSFTLHLTIIPRSRCWRSAPSGRSTTHGTRRSKNLTSAFPARMLVAYLAYTGPVIRTITRYKTMAKAQKNLGAETAVRQRPTIQWLKRTVKLAYWNEDWTPRDVLLDRLSSSSPSRVIRQ